MLQSFFIQKAKVLFFVGVCSVLIFISSYHVAFGVGGTNSHIPFYGELRDGGGAPLTGTYDMLFTIYDAPTAGAVLWTGNYTSANGNAVQVTDGEFSVMLGSGTGNAFPINFSDETYYVGITIGSDDEMIPREEIGSTARAVNSEYLGGFDISSFVLKDTPIDINYTSASSLLTLTQTGSGDFMRLNDAGNATLLSVSNSGQVTASSFENLLDEVNTFAGPLSVMSATPSNFVSNLNFADNAGVVFGNENGLSIFQDTMLYGSNDLYIAPVGSALSNRYVNISTPHGLSFSPNNSDGCNTECGPSLAFNESGSVQMYNTSYGLLEADRYFEIDFSSGTRILSGGLRIGTGGAPAEALDVDGVVRVSSLATGGANLELYADNLGNITTDPFSDERLKENIVSIGSALDMVLDLRGVRYTWRDTNRFGEQTEIGFIAQEVQEVIPEVVRDSGEYLTLNMKNIIPVIVEAIKELNTKVNEYFNRTERLEREVDVLRAEIEALKNGETVESVSPTVEEPVVPETVVPEPEAPAVEETPTEEVPTEEPATGI